MCIDLLIMYTFNIRALYDVKKGPPTQRYYTIERLFPE